MFKLYFKQFSFTLYQPMKLYQKVVLFICVLALSIPTQSQEKESGKDKFVEYFTFYPYKKKVAQDSTLYLSKIIIAPIVSYSPETSLGFGVGLSDLKLNYGFGLRFMLDKKEILDSILDLVTIQMETFM